MNQNPMTILLANSQIDEVTAIKLGIEGQVKNCRVVTTDNGDHAIEVASDHHFHAAIADMRLNDMSGLKLLLRLKAACPKIITILMSACDNGSARKMCLDAGIDFFFEKPLDMARLSAMLGIDPLQGESVFRGTLDNLNVPDALQLVIGRKNAMLMRIDSPRGQGAIEISDGQVIHARLNGRIGEQAFFELVGWDKGHFEIVDVIGPEERTIALPLTQLLMKAAAFQADQQEFNSTQPEVKKVDKSEAKPFFPADAKAPAVNTVWENMAHYKQPETKWNRPKVSVERDKYSGTIPSLKAFRSASQIQSQPLQFKKAPTRVRYSGPDLDELMPKPADRPTQTRRFRPVELPSVRHMLVATLCACCMLFGSVRYLGLLETNYGRDIGASTKDLVKEIAPEGGILDHLSLYLDQKRPSSETVVINNESIVQHLPGKSDTPSVSLTPPSKLWPAYALSVRDDAALLSEPNLIGVTGHVFDRLGLESNPWIEVKSSTGKRIGGMAVRLDGLTEELVIPRALAHVLSLAAENVNTVRMRQVSWEAKAKQSVTFGQSKDLPGRFCQYWYAVGVSLPTLLKSGLTPGENAIIRGPTGMQAVRVQLVDRGNEELIWVSKPVCDAIGLSAGSVNVKLFPQS